MGAVPTVHHHALTVLRSASLNTFLFLILCCNLLGTAWLDIRWRFILHSARTFVKKAFIAMQNILCIWHLSSPPTPLNLMSNPFWVFTLCFLSVCMNIYTYLYIYQSIDIILIQSYINLDLYHFLYIHIALDMCVCAYTYIYIIYTLYAHICTHIHIVLS